MVDVVLEVLEVEFDALEVVAEVEFEDAPDAEVEFEEFAEVDFVGVAHPSGTLKSWQVLQYIIDWV